MWLRDRHLASGWVHVGDYRIHYRFGAGPRRATAMPIIMVHGYGGSGGYLMPTARYLAAFYPTYVLDLPGFGKSSRARQTPDAAALAEVLAAWMCAMGLAEAVWVGNSFGCQVLAHLAARYPSLVIGMALTSPTLDPRARPLGALLARFVRDIPLERPTLIPVIARSFLLCGSRRLWRTLTYLRDDHIEYLLPLARMPAVVVCGERDPLAPPDWGARLAQLLPRGVLTLIPDAPHALPYSRPRELARVIRAFARSRCDVERHAQTIRALQVEEVRYER